MPQLMQTTDHAYRSQAQRALSMQLSRSVPSIYGL